MSVAILRLLSGSALVMLSACSGGGGSAPTPTPTSSPGSTNRAPFFDSRGTESIVRPAPIGCPRQAIRSSAAVAIRMFSHWACVIRFGHRSTATAF